MENRMGTEKISRLVMRTGVPLMLSLLINALYNFVDSVFVSRVAEDALTALSLSAPVQVFVSALGLGNAVGLNAAISRALGEGRPDKVKKTASAAIFIALCSWVLICVACLVGVRWYFDWQSGGNAAIAAYGRDYLSICMLFSLGQMGQWVFDRFVIASGKSHLFLFTLSAASITNLILDPVFIFGFGMGTRGAAIATVIGQFMGLFAGVYINRRWNREISFAFTLKPDWESVRTILRVGVPSTMVQVFTSLVNIAMNTILLGFSTTAVAVFGVCNRMQGLCTVGVHGIDNGLIPIVAYNYGAQAGPHPRGHPLGADLLAASVRRVPGGAGAGARGGDAAVQRLGHDDGHWPQRRAADGAGLAGVDPEPGGGRGAAGAVAAQAQHAAHHAAPGDPAGGAFAGGAGSWEPQSGVAGVRGGGGALRAAGHGDVAAQLSGRGAGPVLTAPAPKSIMGTHEFDRAWFRGERDMPWQAAAIRPAMGA